MTTKAKTIRIDEKDLTEAMELARQSDRTFSSFVRQLIREHLKSVVDASN